MIERHKYWYDSIQSFKSFANNLLYVCPLLRVTHSFTTYHKSSASCHKLVRGPSQLGTLRAAARTNTDACKRGPLNNLDQELRGCLLAQAIVQDAPTFHSCFAFLHVVPQVGIVVKIHHELLGNTCRNSARHEGTWLAKKNYPERLNRDGQIGGTLGFGNISQTWSHHNGFRTSGPLSGALGKSEA